MVDAPTSDSLSGISRRRFLTGSAGIALAAVIAGDRGSVPKLLHELNPVAYASTDNADESPPITFTVERDLDLVLLDFAFYGFTISSTNAGTSLVPGSSNVITVQFPPQAIGEAVYPVSTHKGKPIWDVDPPPVLSGVSGPSRLCFTTSEPVSFTTMRVADLLDWSNWTLLVPPAAHINAPLSGNDKRAATGGIVLDDPSDPQGGRTTYIEYPYGVFVAPAVDATATTTSGFGTSFIATPDVPVAGVNNALWSVALQQTKLTKDGPTPVIAEAAVTYVLDYAKDTLPGDSDGGDVEIEY